MTGGARRKLRSRLCISFLVTIGVKLGVDPSARVLCGARWQAHDLRAGGRRARRRTEVELFANTLESLEDQVDLARSLMAKDMLDRLVGQLTELGMDDVREMVPMMLRECEADQFQTTSSISRETPLRNSFIGACARLPGRLEYSDRWLFSEDECCGEGCHNDWDRCPLKSLHKPNTIG